MSSAQEFEECVYEGVIFRLSGLPSPCSNREEEVVEGVHEVLQWHLRVWESDVLLQEQGDHFGPPARNTRDASGAVDGQTRRTRSPRPRARAHQCIITCR